MIYALEVCIGNISATAETLQILYILTRYSNRHSEEWIIQKKQNCLWSSIILLSIFFFKRRSLRLHKNYENYDRYQYDRVEKEILKDIHNIRQLV